MPWSYDGYQDTAYENPGTDGMDENLDTNPMMVSHVPGYDERIPHGLASRRIQYLETIVLEELDEKCRVLIEKQTVLLNDIHRQHMTERDVVRIWYRNMALRRDAASGDEWMTPAAVRRETWQEEGGGRSHAPFEDDVV